MTERHEHADDELLLGLLGPQGAAPPMRAEFVDALAAQLDREFLQTTMARTTVRARPNVRTVRRRNAVFIGAAASILVALAAWSARPSYSWAAVMEALDRSAWVHTERLRADGEASGWISAIKGVFAVRTEHAVVFDDRQQRRTSLFRAGEQQIYQASSPPQTPWDWQRELVRMLLAAAAQSDAWEVSASQIDLQQESWRRVKIDGVERIELSVALRLSRDQGIAPEQLSLKIILDPETALPLECRLLDAQQHEIAAFAFSYPEQGPASIHALGVPQTLTTVNVSSISQPLRGADDRIVDLRPTPAPPPAPSPESLPATPKSGPPPDDSSAEAAIAWEPPATPLDNGALSRQIDDLLSQLWQTRGIQPAAPSTDEEFMRRAYLDLTGRIPSVSEVRKFDENQDADRRVQLVDELLASRDHATHLAAVWRGILLPDDVDLTRFGGYAKFEEWLAERFGDNVPYDQLVSELLLAEGRISEGGPLIFYAALKMNPEELAARSSRAFLGTRMECAQCHDHPFDDVSQQSFWGFAALFARISRPQGKMEMTSPVLQVRDADYGEVNLPESEQVAPPQLPLVGGTVTDGADSPSRRKQLVSWLTARDNVHFSQATVNRVWAHLFGRGLVDPVDDMRPANAAISPELLDALSRDFAASGFDLRRLLREIASSKAYQLSSRSEVNDPSRTMHFAQMNLKSFTAEQLYDCIAIATQQASTTANDAAAPAGLVRFDDMSRQSFIQKFRAPPGQATDYQAGIPQALALMHGGLIHNATDLSTSAMLRALAAPFFTDEQRLETLFLATLSRRPTAAEQSAIQQGLSEASNAEERQQALGDVLWALLNSAEFTFNH